MRVRASVANGTSRRMRAARRLCVDGLAGLIVAAISAACASVTGLDGYKTGADSCDDAGVIRAMPDSSAPSPEGPGGGETATGSGGPPGSSLYGADDATPPAGDAAEPPETYWQDGSSTDVSSTDAAHPDAADARASEAGSPCGPTDTVQDCGACGRSCDASHSTPSACTGGTCVYAGCAQGWSDCDKAAPNANGCECHTPTCCPNGACQTQHSNGNGQTFYDCVAAGTYNQAQATEACTAFTGNGSQCTAAPPGPCGTTQGVCSSGASTCVCWQYAGTASGTVAQVSGPFCPGMCPPAQGPTWN